MLLCKSHCTARSYTRCVLYYFQLQTGKLICPLLSFLQVSILPVWQSNRHAVFGQCCFCSTAATPVSGYDGTPRGRPILGMNKHAHLHSKAPTCNLKLQTWLILVLSFRSILDSLLSVCSAFCCLSTSSATDGRSTDSNRRRRKTLRSTSRSTALTSPRPTSRENWMNGDVGKSRNTCIQRHTKRQLKS